MIVEDVFQEIRRLHAIESAVLGEQSAPTLIDLRSRLVSYRDWNDAGKQALEIVDLDGDQPLNPSMAGLIAAWSNISASLMDTDIPQEKVIAPIIFDLNLGNFDAVCVRDAADNFGLGIDIGFFRGLESVTHVIASALNAWAVNGYVTENWDRFLSQPEASAKQISWLGSFLDTLAANGSVDQTEMKKTLVDNMGGYFSTFSTVVWGRMCSFIAAHEYAHFLLDHHKPESKTNRAFREHDLVVAKGTVSEKYAHLGESTKVQEDNFLVFQAREYHADFQAQRILEHNGADQTSQQMMRLVFIADLVAIAIFFAYSDAIERIAIIRMTGIDPGKNDLFREDTIVADLHFRTGYPSPYRRFQQLMADVDGRRLGGNGQVGLFVDPVLKIFERVVSAERIDAKLLGSVGQLHDKWKNRRRLAGVCGKINDLDQTHNAMYLMQYWKLSEVPATS